MHNIAGYITLYVSLSGQLLHCLIWASPISPIHGTQTTLLVLLQCIASWSRLISPLVVSSKPALHIRQSTLLSYTHWGTDGHLPHTKSSYTKLRLQNGGHYNLDHGIFPSKTRYNLCNTHIQFFTPPLLGNAWQKCIFYRSLLYQDNNIPKSFLNLSKSNLHSPTPSELVRFPNPLALASKSKWGGEPDYVWTYITDSLFQWISDILFVFLSIFQQLTKY